MNAGQLAQQNLPLPLGEGWGEGARMEHAGPHPNPLPEGEGTTQRGFTLLELLVVILIIGLLTGIVAPRFMGQVSRSEVTTARAQLDALDKALQSYRIDTGRFPTTSQGLKALVTQPADEPRWRGPYLQGDPPVDPWGMPYQYRVPGNNGRDLELMSLGKDRAPGGSGDDADLIR